MVTRQQILGVEVLDEFTRKAGHHVELVAACLPNSEPISFNTVVIALALRH
jgi:hypothetical protein